MAAKKPVKHTIKLVEWLPPSLNEYSRNKGVRFGAVKKLQKVLEPWWSEYSPERIPAAECKRLVKLTLTFPPGARRFDPTNCDKVILDALKNTGFIKGDSADWCECPEPEVEHGLFAMTTIELTDIPPGLNEVADVHGIPSIVVSSIAGNALAITHRTEVNPSGVRIVVPTDQVELLFSIVRRHARELKKKAAKK